MRKIATGVIVAAMVLAACGGSSKSSSTGSGNTSGGSGSTTSGGSSGNSDLSKLAAQYAKAKIKITYVESGSSSSSSTPADNTLTIAQDGSGKSAFTSGTSTFYSGGKSTVSCDGTGSSATCTDLGSAGGAANIGASFTSVFAAFASVLTTLGGGSKSSDTIAGRDASCVKYKASDVIGKLGGLSLFKGSNIKSSDYDPNDSATICIDKQTGFVLKFASTKKGVESDSLTATAVSTPTDSDFTPPVTPVTLPTGVNVPTTGA